MIKQLFCWMLPAATLLLVTPSFSHADEGTDRVADQFRAFCLQDSTDHGRRLLDDAEMPTSSEKLIDKYLSEMKPDGSFDDIQYTVAARSSWPAADHLTRLLTLTVHARQSETDPAQRQKCIAAVHRALAYWIAHDFKCPNWWYNEIGGPKILGNMALLLGPDLQPEELKYIATVVLARSKVGSMTGQNRVWLAGNGVMRAALTHDPALMRKAADVIAEEIQVTDKEGIQPDWSFHQHGPQQQFGNYGMAFAVECARWGSVLHGTPYAFSPQKLDILRDYLLNGQNWIAWHGVLDISACGRQLFPGSPEKKASAIRGVFRSMTTVDAEKAGDYTAYADRNTGDHPNDLTGDKFFWRSDYLIHRQSDWMASLKMSSSRIIGGETVNSENLSGLHLADGALFIYRTGHEYDDIFPAWDWRKIPGTTAVQDQSPLHWGTKNARMMASFVGGACDGTSSCTAMDLQRDHLTAKKAWFICGDTIVCLGAGITSTSDSPVITTVEQCLASDADKGLTGHSVSHAGTRYDLLSPGEWSDKTELRTGNWATVFQSPATPKADVTKNILTITIDHGSHPRGDGYAYQIQPADKQIQSKIMQNSETIQAVSIGDRWSAAVFWTAGEIHLGAAKINADNPCVVINNNGQLTVADPSETLKSLDLKVNGESKHVALPTGGNAGESIALH